MKKSVSKRNLNKISKVNTHKRKSKERRKAELLRQLESINVKHDGFSFCDSDETGRRSIRSGHTVLGVFSGTRSGFGFVSADALSRDIFIPEENTCGAIDGDYVECVYRIYKNYRGEEKTEGRVSKIISRGREFIVGTLYREPSFMRGRHRVEEKYFVVPDDSHLAIRPVVYNTEGAAEGDKVALRIKRTQGSGLTPVGEITAVFGEAEAPRANYSAILFESGIPTDFTEEELAEASLAAEEERELCDRARYDDRIIFTIDGADAKDLDDAVSLKRVKNGWSLGVHIADVSSFVKERGALDRAVMHRGTSVYFTDKVVPMLPTVLSNGACSLNAGEDKLALSAIISLDDAGEIQDVRLEKSVIRSRVRGVYSEVNAVLGERADGALMKKYKEVLPSLRRMHRLYLILKEKSEKRGYMELSIPESGVVLNENGDPISIAVRERGDAERMIEQFMLTANEAVATLLCERDIPCVYRVHADPPEDKLRAFLLTAQNMGMRVADISVEAPDPRELSALLGAAEEKGIAAPVSYMLLRSMAKAEYSATAARHFGLGIQRYCHFTSPIRRLSDLATHRIIHKVLFEGKSPSAYSSYAVRAARAATDTEQRAVNAERKIEELYKVVYMSGHVGEVYDAFVSSVTSFGMFAALDCGCEGLIPLSEMPGFFTFDEKNLKMRSRGCEYALGDRIRVRVEEADISSAKIRLSLEL